MKSFYSLCKHRSKYLVVVWMIKHFNRATFLNYSPFVNGEYSGLNYELINGLQEISFCLYLLQYERDKFIHILFGLGSSHSSHIELADGRMVRVTNH